MKNNQIEKQRKKELAQEKEAIRYQKMCAYEEIAFQKGITLIAGVDEAGRGPLAGPVVAAAVILPKGIIIEGLNDSKLLSEKKRELLYHIIIEKSISYAIGISDEKCIDEINILNATKKAMKDAINSLKVVPEHILIDAVTLADLPISQEAIIKGDSKSISIAAASILAKVTRDRLITEQDQLYPQYQFSKHKGYGTKVHIDAIKKYGICPIHRVSFTKNFV